MKKLLWVGDSPECVSGFGRASREILDVARDHFEVTVLGINYRGDPHGLPYPIYAAAVGGDSHGVGRLPWMCNRDKPDVIVIQNDPWNIPFYIQKLMRFPEFSNIPVVTSVAVDGKNFLGPWLTGVAMSVFWTQFALDEARAGGYMGPATVIPLGVDLGTYRPDDKRAARLRQMSGYLSESFIVGSVNRNQPRKRWDLMIKYFAEWVNSKNLDDVCLYMHTAPTGDKDIDVQQLAKYYGLFNKPGRLVLMEPPTWVGLDEQQMRDTYNCFDVYATTTQGEGFGLTTLEAMACGVPCVVPEWSALGDWAKRGAWMVPCKTTAIGPPYVNVIGGVPDEGAFITALHALYTNREARERNAQAAFECAQQPQFRWENIGRRWVETLETVLREAELDSALKPTAVTA